MPLCCKSKHPTSTGEYVWRRKVGLSAIFDPSGVDVTQRTIPRDTINSAKTHPQPDFGWVGQRPARWSNNLIEARGLDDITKANGRVRMVRSSKGDEQGTPAVELPRDDTEDSVRLPWKRKNGRGQPHSIAEATRGLPPARMKSHPEGFLIPSQHRRVPIVNCSIPGQDGRRRPQSRYRPLNHADLQEKLKHQASKSCAENTQNDLEHLSATLNQQEAFRASSCPPELQGSFVGISEPGQMRRGIPPGGCTQLAEQQLLSPNGELLDVHGRPRNDEPHCSPDDFDQIVAPAMASYQDGSLSSPTCHQTRSHLSGIPRSYGSASCGNTLGMAIPLDSRKVADAHDYLRQVPTSSQSQGEGSEHGEGKEQKPKAVFNRERSSVGRSHETSVSCKRCTIP